MKSCLEFAFALIMISIVAGILLGFAWVPVTMLIATIVNYAIAGFLIALPVLLIYIILQATSVKRYNPYIGRNGADLSNPFQNLNSRDCHSQRHVNRAHELLGSRQTGRLQTDNYEIRYGKPGSTDPDTVDQIRDLQLSGRGNGIKITPAKNFDDVGVFRNGKRIL